MFRSTLTRLLVGLLVLAALLFAQFLAQPLLAQTLLIEGARVIPGDGSPAVDGAAILVENGRITRIGRDVPAPTGAVRVDLAGKTIMPAIIATHVHPGFQVGTSYLAENYKRETVIADLQSSEAPRLGERQ